MDPHNAAAAYTEEEGGAGSMGAGGAQNGWGQEFHLGHVSAEGLTVSDIQGERKFSLRTGWPPKEEAGGLGTQAKPGETGRATGEARKEHQGQKKGVLGASRRKSSEGRVTCDEAQADPWMQRHGGH